MAFCKTEGDTLVHHGDDRSVNRMMTAVESGLPLCADEMDLPVDAGSSTCLIGDGAGERGHFHRFVGVSSVESAVEFVGHPTHGFDGTIVQRLVLFGLLESADDAFLHLTDLLAVHGRREHQLVHSCDDIIHGDAMLPRIVGTHPNGERNVRLAGIAFGADRSHVGAFAVRTDATTGYDMVEFGLVETESWTGRTTV